MFEDRQYFFDAIESNLSSADLLLSEPDKLKKTLSDLEDILQEKWPAVFSSLTDYPLTKKEKNILEKFLKKIENLNKKIGYKITFFNDFQKYMKESIEK